MRQRLLRPQAQLQNQQQQQHDVRTAPEVVDMHCRVLAIDRRNPREVVLFVWDSTDARPMPRG